MEDAFGDVEKSYNPILYFEVIQAPTFWLEAERGKQKISLQEGVSYLNNLLEEDSMAVSGCLVSVEDRKDNIPRIMLDLLCWS